MEIIPTGISGFDELVHGGIVRGNSVLVEGIPGAGKTTFGIEFVYRGITEFNEPGVIVTCEELPESIYRDALNFGWDLRALEEANKLRILCTSPEVLQDAEVNLIEEVVREVGARRILVDSISHFRNVLNDPLSLRNAVYSFCNGLRRLGLTSFLVKEREGEGQREYAFEEYVVDAVIRLENKETPGLHRLRVLEICKTRGQEHFSGKHTFRITDTGIKVFALEGIANVYSEVKEENNQLHTGVPGLDDLLRGGLPRGASVAIAGGSGTGKTVLGLQYLIKGALDYGERGIFLSFEETTSQLLANARHFNWDLHDLQKQELIKLIYMPLSEMEIDETIIGLSEQVKAFGAQRLVLDSIYAFLLRIDNIAVLHEKIYYLVSHLDKLNCTTLLVSPAWEMGGDGKLELLHSVVQGTILLKSIMLQNRRIRQLELYKMRGVNHVMGNHLLEITASGVQVFPRLGG
ncbi:ATPase domain-containing protein [Desulfoscipio gibsoniae]|uniref:non-specific serine/threonine protein kinase n=1 Tax=Desulfoscipio gibsoniae DSM 7213 TaxID=767817 RepID=R4KIB8_9FIRM|nr:ATPase domain-containing protein [Desulfoscipio gibsoniae]AGL00275.1 RecA-superfamily ATPase possibly involved in signal transduction [Desulfoscipio gibsoniae DSM 7213]